MNARVLLLAGALLFVAWAIARVIRTHRFSLRDKVVLITGGSRGLGLVLARQICADGGKVALIARDADELSRANADLVRRGGEVLTVQCDLLDAAQIPSAVRQVIDRLGKIDILINNAGIIEVGPHEHMTREDFERAMQLHFWAVFELVSQILPACRRGQPSLTLTFAARAAIVGNVLFPNLTGYLMKLVNRFLPGAGDEEGNQSRAGSQLCRLTPKWLTRLADRATKRNNEEPVTNRR